MSCKDCKCNKPPSQEMCDDLDITNYAVYTVDYQPTKWDKYFTEIAHATAKLSKDPSSKIGSVIVNSGNRIISTGYNGFVAGCDEEHMTFDRPMKYHITIHAEMNAILAAKQDLSDCVMYVTDAPCENCLKHVLQAGISTVYYDRPDIMRDRGTKEQKEAIRRLIFSCNGSDVKVLNVNTGKSILLDVGCVDV